MEFVWKETVKIICHYKNQKTMSSTFFSFFGLLMTQKLYLDCKCNYDTSYEYYWDVGPVSGGVKWKSL